MAVEILRRLGCAAASRYGTRPWRHRSTSDGASQPVQADQDVDRAHHLVLGERRLGRPGDLGPNAVVRFGGHVI